MQIWKNICSLVIVMLVLANVSFADEHFPFVGEISRGPVNVRAGANTNFEVVHKLSKGDQVVVLGRNFEWYKVQLPLEGAAFVRADYIKVHDGSIGELVGERVNVRAKPNSESSTLGQINKGDLLKLIEKQNDWWKVEPPVSVVGWVHADFVKIKLPQVPTEMMRKPLTADAIKPVPVKPVESVIPQLPLISLQGRIQSVVDPANAEIHYQLLVDGKPVYCVYNMPHLDQFTRGIVHVEGNVTQQEGACLYPVLHIKKISFVL